MAAVDLPEGDRRALGLRARDRTLDCHTADRRAADLEQIIESAGSSAARAPREPAFSISTE
jgi:hypothetical protein